MRKFDLLAKLFLMESEYEKITKIFYQRFEAGSERDRSTSLLIRYRTTIADEIHSTRTKLLDLWILNEKMHTYILYRKYGQSPYEA